MNVFWNKTNRIISLMILIVVMKLGLSVMLIPMAQEGLLLLLITLIVGVIGMISGIVTALGLTLLLYFTVGSSYFWMTFTGNVIFDYNVPNLYLLIWMILLLVIAISTGRISMLIKDLSRENMLLKEQSRILVAVDPITGFDNKDRMLVELESEFNRSQRYGQSFIFLLMKVKYIEQFQKLYGEDEFINMLKHLSKEIYNHTRSSDLKFRPDIDTFALLLTHTSTEGIQVVIEKLNKELRTFQLQNKKFVTLHFEFGYTCFDESMDSFLQVYEQAKEQVLLSVT